MHKKHIMPRQLTPEELKIIRQTEEEGARLAGHDSPSDHMARRRHILRMVAGAAIFIAVFAAFAYIAHLIVSSTAQ